MKSNTNHAPNTDAECLCEKESLMTVFTKVMALLPMNSDFEWKVFSNLTATQIKGAIKTFTADGWTDEFPTLRSESVRET